MRVDSLTADGDVLAKPLEWQGEGVEPVVLFIPRKSDPALGVGERILAKLSAVTGEAHHYEARLIRRIGSNPQRILGVFRKGSEGGRVLPIDKGSDRNGRLNQGPLVGQKMVSWLRPNRLGQKAAWVCHAPESSNG